LRSACHGFLSISLDVAGSTQAKQAIVELTENDPDTGTVPRTPILCCKGFLRTIRSIGLCPSSKSLGQLIVLFKGGFGSSRVDVKPTTLTGVPMMGYGEERTSKNKPFELMVEP